MRFMKDTEKEQLKRLVKACMLEISKLKMDLKKCKEENKNSIQESSKVNELQESSKVNELNSKIQIKNNRIQVLENFIKEKDNAIKKLQSSLDEKDSQIIELEKIKTYFEALTAKPKSDLTSFQSQVYLLLPHEKSDTSKLHEFIKEVGFKELSYDNMFHILRNLERKGYFKSYQDNDEVMWEKIVK
jgi:vacuolar-type H+-ATPase subunit I/STV1